MVCWDVLSDQDIARRGLLDVGQGERNVGIRQVLEDLADRNQVCGRKRIDAEVEASKFDVLERAVPHLVYADDDIRDVGGDVALDAVADLASDAEIAAAAIQDGAYAFLFRKSLHEVDVGRRVRAARTVAGKLVGAAPHVVPIDRIENFGAAQITQPLLSDPDFGSPPGPVRGGGEDAFKQWL